jgi:hypothetical protein
MVLRHQLHVLQRKLRARVRYRPSDRAILAALRRFASSIRVAVVPGHLRDPASMREAAKRKWRRWRKQRGPGRPPMSDRVGRAHRPSGPREPTLGVCPHPGRATKARYPRLGHIGAEDPASAWSRTCSTERPDVDRVPSFPSTQRVGHGLLHGGHRVAQAALRALRHRAIDSRGAHPRYHRPSDRRVRNSGGAQSAR